MKKFTEYIGSQCRNPRGFIGKICCYFMNIINIAMYQSIVSCMKPNDKLNVLDIGYGNGYMVKKLYKKTGAAIFGIDISADMVKIASKKNRRAVEEKKVKLSIGDCCELSFNDGMFDTVASVNTIYFWNDTVKGLSEIHRVLKDGGVFYNAVYTKELLQKLSYTKKGFQLFEKKDYKNLGKKAGFSKIEIKEIAAGRSYLIRYIK